MELKKIILSLLFPLFLFYSCTEDYKLELNESVSTIVKNDKDIERVYNMSLKLMKKLKGKKNYNDDIYTFLDEECNLYESKYDEIKKQRNLYRVIHYINSKTSESLSINFYKTNDIDVEINFFYSKKGITYKCLIGTFDDEKQIYIFDKVLYF